MEKQVTFLVVLYYFVMFFLDCGVDCQRRGPQFDQTSLRESVQATEEEEPEPDNSRSRSRGPQFTRFRGPQFVREEQPSEPEGGDYIDLAEDIEAVSRPQPGLRSRGPQYQRPPPRKKAPPEPDAPTQEDLPEKAPPVVEREPPRAGSETPRTPTRRGNPIRGSSNFGLKDGASDSISDNNLNDREKNDQEAQTELTPQDIKEVFGGEPNIGDISAGSEGQDFVSECPLPNGFFADAFDCDRYYECKSNVIQERRCPDGQVFNDYSVLFGRCDFPFNVDCTDRPGLQPAKSSPNCPRENGYFSHPDPTKCTEFFFCTDGVANPITCPGGLIFDPSKGSCGWPEEVKRKGCAGEDIYQFECPETALKDAQAQGQQHPRYVDVYDCQFFYICIDGKVPRKNGCPLGQVFNDVTGSCDEPKNVPDCADWYEGDSHATTTTTRPITTQRSRLRAGSAYKRTPVKPNRRS
ncbi:unnamed protein product [Cyprideis torosa]|uniref:Uncharacterized protein n=1 Tax=Cyprideis torosa TaxID=163714 RepID=A0A7R8ZQJ2_9CRUS|nr:unnamed protein product [Cyprideis torosa]CAG0890806.1 unnamed protein product [Cyprideis torosa]